MMSFNYLTIPKQNSIHFSPFLSPMTRTLSLLSLRFSDSGLFFTLTFLMLHAFWPGPYPTLFYFWYCSDPFFSFDPSVKFLTQNFLPLFLTFIILFFFLFVFKSNVASLKANCSQWIPSFSLLAFSYPVLFYILKASCLKFEILTKLYMRAF